MIDPDQRVVKSIRSGSPTPPIELQDLEITLKQNLIKEKEEKTRLTLQKIGQITTDYFKAHPESRKIIDIPVGIDEEEYAKIISEISKLLSISPRNFHNFLLQQQAQSCAHRIPIDPKNQRKAITRTDRIGPPNKPLYVPDYKTWLQNHFGGSVEFEKLCGIMDNLRHAPLEELYTVEPDSPATGHFEPINYGQISLQLEQRSKRIKKR